MTLLFDLPVGVGLRRALSRIAGIKGEGAVLEDRFEREEQGFHQKIRAGYLALAKEDPGSYRIIDASREIPVVHSEVCAHLQDFMER